MRIQDAIPIGNQSQEIFILELNEIKALLIELQHSYVTSGSNPVAYQAITRMMRFVREHELDSGNSQAT